MRISLKPKYDNKVFYKYTIKKIVCEALCLVRYGVGFPHSVKSNVCFVTSDRISSVYIVNCWLVGCGLVGWSHFFKV